MSITSVQEQIYLVKQQIMEYTLRLETALTVIELNRWNEKIDELEFKLLELEDELSQNTIQQN